MDITHWILAVFLALSLAASIGLNTCLPLLMLATAAHFHIAGVALNEHYAWLTSNSALAVLAIAAVLEMIGDKIPVVDHAMHTFGLIVRPMAGALAAASVFTHADPTTAAIAGLILGAPTAFGFHAATSAVRVASSATTLGIANPFLSTLQDLSAACLTTLGILTPIAVPVALIAAALILWKLAKAAKNKLPSKQS